MGQAKLVNAVKANVEENKIELIFGNMSDDVNATSVTSITVDPQKYVGLLELLLKVAIDYEKEFNTNIGLNISKKEKQEG